MSKKDIKEILTQFNSILGQNTLIVPKFSYTGENFNNEHCDTDYPEEIMY